MLFVRTVAALAPDSSEVAPTKLTTQTPDGQTECHELMAGQRVDVLIPKGEVASFSELYVNTTTIVPPAVIDDSLLDPAASLQVNLNIEDDIDPERLERFVHAFLPPDTSIPPWPKGWLGRPLTALPTSLRDAHQNQGWLICTLKVAAASIHHRPGVAIDAQTLASLPGCWQAHCLRQLATGPLFVFSRRLGDLTTAPEHTVFAAENGVIAWSVRRSGAKPFVEALVARNLRPTKEPDLDEDISLMV